MPPKPQSIKTIADLIVAMEHVGEYTGPYRTVHLYADNLPGLIAELKSLTVKEPGEGTTKGSNDPAVLALEQIRDCAVARNDRLRKTK